jgi:hydroxymethylpyrimidine/phosphomethylpyrimidine kinase
MKRALTIAGSDSGGGAGIQADLRVFAALGVYGLSTITAVTAQNTLEVSGIEPVKPALVAAQIKAVLSDIGADAVKIGLLHDEFSVHAVASVLPAGLPVVLDPVMVASSGQILMHSQGVTAMRELLFARTTLLTPNIPEAEVLLGGKITHRREMAEAAHALLRLGPQAVLLKGGHLAGDECADIFVRRDSERWLAGPRIDTRNTHGTGCTLSAAITACLASGEELVPSVEKAVAFLRKALRDGSDVRLGKGHGPALTGILKTGRPLC